MPDTPDRIDKVLRELDDCVVYQSEGVGDGIEPALAAPILRAFAASIVKDCAGKARGNQVQGHSDSCRCPDCEPATDIADELDTYAKEIENAG